jgi:hypothetical protein
MQELPPKLYKSRLLRAQRKDTSEFQMVDLAQGVADEHDECNGICIMHKKCFVVLYGIMLNQITSYLPLACLLPFWLGSSLALPPLAFSPWALRPLVLHPLVLHPLVLRP